MAIVTCPRCHTQLQATAAVVICGVCRNVVNAAAPWGAPPSGYPPQGYPPQPAGYPPQSAGYPPQPQYPQQQSYQPPAAAPPPSAAAGPPPSRPPQRPERPQLQPKKGHGVARALYKFEKKESTDLPFDVNDEIEVFEIVDDQWGKGKCHGKVGNFPLNYVDIIIQPKQKGKKQQGPDKAFGHGRPPRPNMHGGGNSGGTSMAGRAMNNVVNGASTGYGWSFGSTLGRLSAQSLWNKF
eukprot:m.177721 g.177721  ORF g.177721 m.177721 type:complete len:238 (+) comp17970_c0_seq1:2760-3473(+)